MSTNAFLGTIVFAAFATLIAAVPAVAPSAVAFFSLPIVGPLLGLLIAAYVGYDLAVRAGLASRLHPYVWAIVFGLALQVPLAPLVRDQATLTLLAELSAAILLFAGGLSIPIRNLGKYLGPIAGLSVVGAVLAALVFAGILGAVTSAAGIPVAFSALFLLGLVLAPSDPLSLRGAGRMLASIRPTLRKFVETEGVANDIVGVVAVRLVLVALLTIAGTGALSGTGLAATVFGPVSLLFFAFEMGWGVLVALVSAWILKAWGHPIHRGGFFDRLPFFVVPFFSFALGSVGGAGFLAVFLTGLFYEERAGHALSRVSLDRFALGIVAPLTFVLLGALVPLTDFSFVAPVGVFAAVLFMLAVRPLAVAVSLMPWTLRERPFISFHESVYLSFLREAGPVTAALLMLVYASGVAGGVQVLTIGLWVVLTLLLLEPSVAAAFSRRLGIERD